MECLPVVIVLLLLFTGTFTSGQTDFRQSPPGDRRSRFFPPPDRLSPTRKPILSASQPHSSRFHVQSQPSSVPKPPQPPPPPQSSNIPPSVKLSKKTSNESDPAYYDYYEEYYYDILNSTNPSDFFYYDDKDSNKAKKVEPVPKIKKASLSSRLAATSFRFSPPAAARVTPSATRVPQTPKPTLQQLGATSSPFRFRFGAENPKPREDNRRPPSVVPRTAVSGGSRLADLIAKLSEQASQPTSNDVDSNNRKGRMEKTNSQRIPHQKPSVFSIPRSTAAPEKKSKVRVTNSTESTFVVASIQSSHSLKVKGNDEGRGTSPLASIPLATTQNSLINFVENNEADSHRAGSDRRLEGPPSDRNLETFHEKIVRPPFEKKNLASLFGNIQISVNPSIFNSSIDQIVTERAPISPEITLSTTRSFSTSQAVIDNLFNSIPREDVSALLPEGFSTEATFKASTIDISSFLPADYKLKEEVPDSTLPSSIPVAVKPVDISKFLPPGFELKEETEEPTFPGGLVIQNVDISQFIPKGFAPKPVEEEKTKVETTPKEVIEETKPAIPGVVIQNVDLSKFLPPGFKLNKPTTTSPAPVTSRIGHAGIVFPRRRVRPTYLTTSTTPSPDSLAKRPALLKPKITNLFDRVKALASTEGYVAPIITEAPRKVGEINQESETKSSTSTTTTTTTTTTTVRTTTLAPRPTTPGVCGSQCRLAGSLKISTGAEWAPELANRDTREFQELANEIEGELNNFLKRGSLARWFDYIEIDSFNPGTVIVSYILHLKDIREDIDTTDLKEKLNTDLSIVDHSLGKFEMDPKGTDFIVMQEHVPYVAQKEQDFLIPEWLIAVIVIGLASFLFILIFGIVALVSRARNRKRASPPLTEEILNNLNALQQVGGLDNYAVNGIYGMDTVWNEKMLQEKSMKPPSSRGKGYNPEYNVNIYDSWRTDYSDPYSSSANNSRRRPELDLEGKQFYSDDPYDF